MELTQTITLLENRKAALQEELQAIELAISTLKNTYEPELKVIENANKEITSLKSEKDILSSAIIEKETIIQTKELELTAVVEAKETLETELTAVTTEKETLEANLETKILEVETVTSEKAQLVKALSDKEIELSTLKTAPIVETIKEEVITE